MSSWERTVCGRIGGLGRVADMQRIRSSRYGNLSIFRDSSSISKSMSAVRPLNGYLVGEFIILLGDVISLGVLFLLGFPIPFSANAKAFIDVCEWSIMKVLDLLKGFLEFKWWPVPIRFGRRRRGEDRSRSLSPAPASSQVEVEGCLGIKRIFGMDIA